MGQYFVNLARFARKLFWAFRTLHLAYPKLVWTPCSFLFSGSTRLSGKLQPQCALLLSFVSRCHYCFHCCWHEQWNGRFRSPIACKKNDANALTEKICLWRIIWIKCVLFSKLSFASSFWSSYGLSKWAEFLLRWHAQCWKITQKKYHSKSNIYWVVCKVWKLEIESLVWYSSGFRWSWSYCWCDFESHWKPKLPCWECKSIEEMKMHKLPVVGNQLWLRLS